MSIESGYQFVNISTDAFPFSLNRPNKIQYIFVRSDFRDGDEGPVSCWYVFISFYLPFLVQFFCDMIILWPRC